MIGRVLLLFTKPARAGRVKTRLIGDLSAEQAASLHQAFVEDILAELRRGSFELRVAWALDDGEEPPDTGAAWVRQEGGDLGERLFHALRAAAADGALVAAVGSDHPDLPAARIEEAFQRLEAGADVVLGPASDGGYYLIALRPSAVRRALFADIAWSTETVLETTLARCAAAGLAVELLAVSDDVDLPADLRRLAAAIACGEVQCPHTEAVLRDIGWLPQEVRS